MAKILVVDDEENIAELIKFNLEKEGHQVKLAHDGRAGVDLALADSPELIVLDVLLPELDGMEVCRILKSREETSAVPIIMLSAKSGVVDKVLALELGAEDYMTKPFSPRELAARIKARLRDREKQGQKVETEENVLERGSITLDPNEYEVRVDGLRLHLAPKEFKLLKVLMSNPGRVYKRNYLLNYVWGVQYEQNSRTVDVHIRCLRQKIEQDPANPKLIETIRGIGYRFRD